MDVGICLLGLCWSVLVIAYNLFLLLLLSYLSLLLLLLMETSVLVEFVLPFLPAHLIFKGYF